MTQINVVCPGCRGEFHRINERFNPFVHPDGTMFELNEPWSGWCWSTFSRQAEGYGVLVCPACEAPYAPGGFISELSGGVPDRIEGLRRLVLFLLLVIVGTMPDDKSDRTDSAAPDTDDSETVDDGETNVKKTRKRNK